MVHNKDAMEMANKNTEVLSKAFCTLQKAFEGVVLQSSVCLPNYERKLGTPILDNDGLISEQLIKGY